MKTEQTYVLLTVLSKTNFSFSDYEAFKEAAEQFQPYIKFFATFEKSVSSEQTHNYSEKSYFFSDPSSLL